MSVSINMGEEADQWVRFWRQEIIRRRRRPERIQVVRDGLLSELRRRAEANMDLLGCDLVIRDGGVVFCRIPVVARDA